MFSFILAVNCVDSGGAISIAESLMVNQSLTKMDLRSSLKRKKNGTNSVFIHN